LETCPLASTQRKRMVLVPTIAVPSFAAGPGGQG
jgi:hypothetical protein